MGAASYTLWHSGNDGAGSGLDADLLDGTSSAAFVSGGVNKKSTSSASMNDLTVPSGFYFYSAATGAPTAEWYNWMTVMGDSWNSSDNYGFQLAHNFWNTDLYVRRVQSGAWQSWNKIWHNGNDGAGSGLDADTVDGYNPSSSVAGSTLALRDVSGYLFGNYFNMTADVTTGTASHIAVATSSDNYLRWQTPAQFLSNHGLGGMTLLGTMTTTSGASQSVSSLTLTSYKLLYLAFSGVSGTTGTFYITINGVQISATAGSAAQVNDGGVWVDLDTSRFMSVLTSAAGTRSQGGNSGLTTGSTAVTIAVNAGTFDAGTVKVYGLK